MGEFLQGSFFKTAHHNMEGFWGGLNKNISKAFNEYGPANEYAACLEAMVDLSRSSHPVVIPPQRHSGRNFALIICF
jgi:hypothetical protein